MQKQSLPITSEEMLRAVLVVLAFVLSIAWVPLAGFSLSLLWGWFVVPLGLPSVGVAHGIGIRTLLAMASSSRTDDYAGEPGTIERAKSLASNQARNTAMELLRIVLGWLVAWFASLL